MLNKAIRRSFAAVNTKIAIVGAGCGGSSVSAQLINSGAFKAEDITIFDPEEKHHYQPGYTNVAGGIWGSKNMKKYALEQKYIMRDRKDNLPEGINWVRE